MAKGERCRVTNCKNIITYKGRMCGTHKWRITTHGSYDLPSHTGQPNYFVTESIPNGFVVNCKKHGLLKIEETYPRKCRSAIYYKCKRCIFSLNIKNKYKGLNGLDDYDRMLVEQEGKCGMCKTTQNNTTRNGKIKRFNIDHCHKTGKVRKLLCSFCNSLLGYSNDSIEILESAIKYLKDHEKEIMILGINS